MLLMLLTLILYLLKSSKRVYRNSISVFVLISVKRILESSASTVWKGCYDILPPRATVNVDVPNTLYLQVGSVSGEICVLGQWIC